MNARPRLTSVIAALILMTGALLSISAPAHAAGGHVGVCASNYNNSWCWYVKSTNGAATGYTRDITYSPNEDFVVTYEGTVSSTGCDIGGIPNVGVYSFYDSIDGGGYVGAGYTSNGGVQYWLGNQSSLNLYAEWAWTSSGVLENCYDSAGTGCQYAYAIPAVNFNGSQMYTECVRVADSWDQYDPPLAIGDYFLPRYDHSVDLQPRP